MARPKRSAAAMAVSKIREVLEWEELPEQSVRFKECAARIDAEFAAEQKSKRVKQQDLGTGGTPMLIVSNNGTRMKRATRKCPLPRI